MEPIRVNELTHRHSNLMWGRRHFRELNEFMEYSYATSGDVVYIHSVMNDRYSMVESLIKQVSDTIEFDCECRFHRGNSACGHIIAAIYLYNSLRFEHKFENMTRDNFDDFKYKIEKQKDQQRKVRRLEREYKSKRELGSVITDIFNNAHLTELKDIINDDLYHLEFEVTIDKHNYGYLDSTFPVIQLRAKIGADKLYIIKNFNEFFDNVVNGVEHRYGKNLNFVHSINAFDEVTADIIPRLHKFHDEINPNGISSRSLSVTARNFDIVFELLKDYPREYVNITVNEVDYEMHLEVEELTTGEYKLSLEKDNNTYDTNYTLYKIDDHYITRLNFQDEKSLRLCKLLIEEEYSILSKSELDTILHILREDDKDNIIVHGYEVEALEMVDSSVYIDIEDNDIIVWGKIENDNITYDLFDPAFDEDININKVRYILHSFMTDKVDNKLLMSLDKDSTYRFLQKGISYLNNLSKVYANESLRNISKPSSLDIKIGVTVDNGLLAVNFTSIKYSSDELDEILHQYRRKRKFYKLKSGEVINLDAPELEELDELAQQLGVKTKILMSEKVSLPLYRSLQLENEMNDLVNIEIDVKDQLETFNANFKEQKLDDIKIFDQYIPILKDYQAFGVKWMNLLANYGFNGILADDMGLGKTLQVIALLENHKSDLPSIVVAPASLLFNWEDELKKFNANLTYTAVHGSKEERKQLIKQSLDKDLIITTYDYLRNDFEDYQDVEFAYMIIDEAQYIKNQNTQTAKAVKTLSAKHRLALTGTPIENTLAELWSIFDFIMPGYLYTYNYFRKNYETPIVKNNDIVKQKRLRAMVEPFILRRIKRDVLKDLPEKTEKVLKIEFSEDEEKLYLAKLAQGSKEVKQILNSNRKNNILILKLLTELRQLCIDPRMLYEDIETVSSKVKAVVEFLEQFKLTKQKTLLFSSFTKSLDLIERELQVIGISYYRLTGSNTKQERRDLVEAFQTDDTLVFLISLKAAGVGLNLTAAENVIHFDPWWNVAAENQASDRAHRIGQTKSVQVLKFVMKDSIEEKILKMQERKKEMSDIFIEGASGSFASLSKDDILDLFNQS